MDLSRGFQACSISFERVNRMSYDKRAVPQTREAAWVLKQLVLKMERGTYEGHSDLRRLPLQDSEKWQRVT